MFRPNIPSLLFAGMSLYCFKHDWTFGAVFLLVLSLITIHVYVKEEIE